MGLGQRGGWGVPLSADAAALMIAERARNSVHEEVTTGHGHGDKRGGEEEPHALLGFFGGSEKGVFCTLH